MLLAGLKHQFSHTFSVETQYAWAHAWTPSQLHIFATPYLYNPSFAYGRSDFDINQSFKLFGIWQPVIFRGSHNWVEKIVGGWSLSGIFSVHSGYGWTPVYQAPHQIYCNTCNYGFQNLRPHYLGGAGSYSGNYAFKTGSNFPNPGKANTGTNNNQFTNNYFMVPNYQNAITDSPGQATNNFIPPPGLIRNSFPGPFYRDVDLNIAKAFGLPKMPVLGKTPGSKSRPTCLTLSIF